MAPITTAGDDSPDVCSCCVSQNESVGVARKGQLDACQDLPVTFSFKLLGVGILKKSNTETRVYRTKFDIVSFI